MVCNSNRSTYQGKGGAFVKGEAVTRPRPGAAAAAADPLVVLGLDLFCSNVLPRLDASSLAVCAAVCSSWRSCCTSHLLWQPLLTRLLALRAHIPLPLLRSPSPIRPHVAYSIIMLDAAKVELSPEEMCARIWEMNVKPTCGTYWYFLDPTSRNEDPLLRRFHCDHSISPMQDENPIWGGQENTWQVVMVKSADGKQAGQRVQVNSWAQHQVIHLPDGRWRLENYFTSYTTCPDQEDNMPSYVKGKVIRVCPRCNPGPSKEEE